MGPVAEVDNSWADPTSVTNILAAHWLNVEWVQLQELMTHGSLAELAWLRLSVVTSFTLTPKNLGSRSLGFNPYTPHVFIESCQRGAIMG